MKKFAYLNWAKTLDDIELKHNWIKSFPSFIKYRYLIKYVPIKVEEISLLGASGFAVQIPITIEEITPNSHSYIQKIIDKIMEILKENEVNIICPPKEKSNKFTYSIPIAKGKCIIPFFMYSALIKIIKETFDESLKNIEVTIIDGNNQTTDLVLDIIYPHINYLNIVSDDIKRFNNKTVEIYEDVGLNLQLLSHNKKIPLESSEIIIDCTDKAHNDFYYCSKKTVYFYLGNNDEMAKNILIKCPHIMLIDDFILSLEKNKYSTAFCQMLWYVSKQWFEIALSKEYTFKDLKQITKEIKKEGWEIDSFCQCGKIVDKIIE